MNTQGYKVTIGLEIHVHLKTKTKMFSPSLNDPFHAEPNQNISPIDLAHPGTLPTINKKALEHMVRVGLAVKGIIANFTEFDRKNYFYPDIPKGYQISQYKHPIVSGGSLAGFALTRIHLEEDTATSKHFDDYSLVDFNRAGAPLMELVTEPVLHSSEDVVIFARELQLLLRYLGASDANIEKGEMRVEVNLSVSKTEELGTKVEVKNIGSISAAGKATEYEIQRQIEVLESGGQLVQETRGWDDRKEITFSQRSKENAKDYRYFPEPDLPKLYLHKMFNIEEIKSELPELPEGKRKRFADEFGLKSEDIEFYIQNSEIANFFEELAFQLEHNPEKLQLSSNIIISDIMGILRKPNITHLGYRNEGENRDETFLKSERVQNIWTSLEPEYFVTLISMSLDKEINSTIRTDILKIMMEQGGDPRNIATENDWLQQNDTETLKVIVQKIIEDNKEQVIEYRGGKETLIQYFVGQGMKETKGAGNPEILKELFIELL